jgi:Prolyl oligopeptidase family
MAFQRFASIAWIFLISSSGWADGPADNQAVSVRPIPPAGIMISASERTHLDGKLGSLKQSIEKLRGSKSATVRELLPDVEVFARAVSLALSEDGFFEPKDVERAKEVLLEGEKRAAALDAGAVYWLGTSKTDTMGERNPRTIVRGFRSRLDGTVQPYGVVDRTEPGEKNVRADVWCRGRSEKGLELQFIASRMTSTEPMPAAGVLMIHPFGRYCNANKLAGEVDTLEVLEHAMQQYPIDPRRVAIRGFSMGGAAAWHLAVHYPDKWFAANPGAGFSETPMFLKVFQSETLKPTWYEQKLWQMHDCPIWARNLRTLPTIAYSGEIDNQKQAADVMAEACWNLPGAERFELTHIIAPRTAHKIDPIARIEIEKRLSTLDRIRTDKVPNEVFFTTTTLKYNRSHWITINALKEHWQPATILANIWAKEGRVFVSAENVTDFSIDFAADQAPEISGVVVVPYKEHPNTNERFNSLSYASNASTERVSRKSDRSWGVRLRLEDGKWVQVSPIERPSKALGKKHGLQGPIDDALMGPFLFVKPSKPGRFPEVDKWVESEFQHAVREWHRQMRGDVRIKTSEELKPEDIENYHLILWGDAQSNPTLAKVMDKLPVQWGSEQIVVGDRTFSSKTHAPILIYPNPLNPERYVVLNSGFTYREYDYLNNARQVPKLPDWAIVDLTTPPDSRWPGKIVDADFFGEKWELKPKH